MPKVQSDVDLMLTLLLVDTEHHDDLVATDPDELLDTSNTSSRKLGKQDHAVDVVYEVSIKYSGRKKLEAHIKS